VDREEAAAVRCCGGGRYLKYNFENEFGQQE
jgi:hypothetical protein